MVSLSFKIKSIDTIAETLGEENLNLTKKTGHKGKLFIKILADLDDFFKDLCD